MIEDAAHAHGALERVQGIAAAYSFYPTKNLGALGDGGALVTDDGDLAEAVRRIRVHGRDSDGIHREISTNSRLSELSAMSLRVQLPHLDAWNARRGEIARRYRDSAPALAWQEDHERHVNHLCVLRRPDRDGFRDSLPCETGLHYPRAIVDEPAYARFERAPVPIAREWAAACVSLPCHPALGDGAVEMISRALAAGADCHAGLRASTAQDKPAGRSRSFR